MFGPLKGQAARQLVADVGLEGLFVGQERERRFEVREVSGQGRRRPGPRLGQASRQVLPAGLLASRGQPPLGIGRIEAIAPAFSLGTARREADTPTTPVTK